MIQQTNCNTKPRIPANTRIFLITLVHPTQDSFDGTNTLFYVHTYLLFGLQVHSTEHDKAHTSESGTWAQMHISQVWIPLASSCAVTLLGSTIWAVWESQHKPLFSCCSLSLSHTMPLRCRQTPTGMQKYGLYIYIYIQRREAFQ